MGLGQMLSHSVPWLSADSQNQSSPTCPGFRVGMRQEKRATRPLLHPELASPQKKTITTTTTKNKNNRRERGCDGFLRTFPKQECHLRGRNQALGGSHMCRRMLCIAQRVSARQRASPAHSPWVGLGGVRVFLFEKKSKKSPALTSISSKTH